MLRLHGSTTRLENGFRSAQFQTGRLGNQFAGLAGHIAGVHPVVGNLAQAMGNFAIGAGLTVGVLAGVAAIALVYEKLTGEARKAKKETDELIESFKKAQELKSAGGTSGKLVTELEKRVTTAREALANPFSRGSTASLQTELDTAAALLRAATAEQNDVLKAGGESSVKTYASNLASLISSNRATQKERQNALTLIRVWTEDMKRLAPSDLEGRAELSGLISTLKTPFDKQQMKFSYNELRNEITKTRKEAEEFGKAWWLHFAMINAQADKLTASMKELLGFTTRGSQLDYNPLNPNLNVSGSGVDLSQGLTKEQIKTRQEMGILIDDANQNAQNIRDAIWGAASQSANMIVGALNIGGGGRGSQLGGALGGTAGFAAGFIFGGGPVGGAIGSTVGNIIGSALGGLFDSNSRAVNSNTQALYANTAALLLNAPSGYKVAAGRFAATDVKEWRRDVQRLRTRGGAPILAGT